MAPSRKINNNGRSPLVNKQHQITAFFTKSPSPLLKSNPQSSPLNPEKIQCSKPQNPNPKPSPSPSSSPPATTSPINPKSIIKPPLVIGSQKTSDSPANSKKKLYGGEVVNRRIRVYWPLDAAWYEGRVKAFNTVSGKHLVEYEDDEEELIDLENEKIEWIEESGVGELGFSGKRLNKRRRLRKASIVDDDEDGDENVGPVEDDDSSDEDWGKNGVDVEDEDKCEEEVELEDEDEVVSLKRKKRKSVVSGVNKKLKDEDGNGELANSDKKKKPGFVFGGFGGKPGKPISNVQGN